MQPARKSWEERIVDEVYHHVTEDLGVEGVRVACSGASVYVTCEDQRARERLRQIFRDGWQGLYVEVLPH